jgi:hypothetical protein
MTYSEDLYEANRTLRRIVMSLTGTNAQKLAQIQSIFDIKIVSIKQVNGEWLVTVKNDDGSLTVIKNATKLGALKDLATINNYKVQE